MKWRCVICGYIHEGDNPPETCPVCGVDSSNFVTDSFNNAGSTTMNSVQTILSPEEAIVKAVQSISYGLFIITAAYNGKDNGQAANTCFQITSDPVQIAIGINKKNYTHELIMQSGRFGVSVLDQKGHDLVRRFGYRSGKETDKFDGIKAHRGSSGIMLPDEVLTTMEAEVVNSMDTGTHTLFLGRVTVAEVRSTGEPMTYAYFRKTK
ncbi:MULTISPECIES: flavin reductase [unclassified Dehalobacter]|uniref:flavin reductase n=1 Tax=unclassified Dehalobacter TaxID=2635733 RepID=UPI0003A4040C|nr:MULTISPECIES: flavin reductase [unclassified Dehalobacter]RJE46895.1 flavin reductase [Dehalobacter sp. MCB1]TCX50818.1 flavin reductase [Dehalobacter sp. 12DCB1]TCX51529.1 flavin reductase [Dehalobacter sp. 14DCB1]